MDGRRKWQKAISELERKNYRNLRYLLKGTTETRRKNTLRIYVAIYWDFQEQNVLI